MTVNVGVARITEEGRIYGTEEMSDLERAQKQADEMNEWRKETKSKGDRWIVVEIREYGVRAKLYRFDIYRENTDFEQYGVDATSPEDALSQFFDAWKDEVLPEPKDHYTAYSHEYEVDKRKGRG